MASKSCLNCQFIFKTTRRVLSRITVCKRHTESHTLGLLKYLKSIQLLHQLLVCVCFASPAACLIQSCRQCALTITQWLEEWALATFCSQSLDQNGRGRANKMQKREGSASAHAARQVAARFWMSTKVGHQRERVCLVSLLANSRLDPSLCLDKCAQNSAGTGEAAKATPRRRRKRKCIWHKTSGEPVN